MYRKKTYRRRAPRRRYRRRMTAKRVKQIVESSVNWKFRDSSFTNSVSDSATINELTQIAQGTAGTAASDQRVDESIKIKSIFGRLCMSVADTTNIVRVIIMQWNKSTAPTSAAGPLNATATVLSHYNVDANKGQYRVLYDKSYAMTFDGPGAKSIKFFLKFKKPLVCNYTSSSSTSGYKGRIYAYLISDSSAASHPSVDQNYRLKFCD